MLPLLVDLAGRRVVAVGAGAVAARKVLPLVDEGADVVVVAPDADPGLAAAADAGRLTWHARPWEPGDLDGAVLVVAATADAGTNAAVAAAADARATLCVRVDRGGQASAALAGAVRRGPLIIAVGTDGQAPALARHLRAELADAYGPEWGELAALMGALRRDPQVQAALARLDDEARAARWRSLVTPDILALVRAGRLSTAKEVATACLCSSSV